MPRRGRSPSPTPRSAPRTSLPARAPPAAPMAPPPHAAAVGQPKQPGLFAQMAATAGGVAVGSAVGHTVGHAMTGMFSGGGSEAQQQEAPLQQQYPQQNAYAGQENGPCGWEIKQFLQCAQSQSDLTLCQGFNEAIQQCKYRNNIP